MANVENPYETNLSNNLVVTSYVDEFTVKSDYYLDLYSIYGGDELLCSIPFRTYKNFYRESPLEQTATLSHGNPDPEKYAGMYVADTAEDDNIGEYQNMEIRRKSDNYILDLAKATILSYYHISDTDFDGNPDKNDFNLNNQVGWNLFVDYLAIMDEETGIYDPFDYNVPADADVSILLLFIQMLYNKNNIFIPISILNDKPEKSYSEKPDGWYKISSCTLYIEDLNFYIMRDFPSSYNIIENSNVNVSTAINNLESYINGFSKVSELNKDTLISLIEEVNHQYSLIPKYTNTEGTYVNNIEENFGAIARLQLNDPTTEFYKSLLTGDNGIPAESTDYFPAPKIHIWGKTEDSISMIRTVQGPGTSAWHITSPELEHPLNIILESSFSYCFADNSMVSTDKGLVAMKDLTLDHNVKCWDFDNGCITYAKPLFIQTHGKVSRSFEAVFDDGTICKYSKPHRCYCVDTRLFESLSYARNIGKSFYFEDGSIKKLVEWRVVDEPTTVYTMLTDHYMTSFVDGILAGSNMVMIYFIDKDMKYYKKPERKGNRSNNFGISDKIFRGLRLYESPIPKGIIMRWLKREFISF